MSDQSITMTLDQARERIALFAKLSASSVPPFGEPIKLNFVQPANIEEGIRVFRNLSRLSADMGKQTHRLATQIYEGRENAIRTLTIPPKPARIFWDLAVHRQSSSIFTEFLRHERTSLDRINKSYFTETAKYESLLTKFTADHPEFSFERDTSIEEAADKRIDTLRNLRKAIISMEATIAIFRRQISFTETWQKKIKEGRAPLEQIALPQIIITHNWAENSTCGEILNRVFSNWVFSTPPTEELFGRLVPYAELLNANKLPKKHIKIDAAFRKKHSGKEIRATEELNLALHLLSEDNKKLRNTYKKYRLAPIEIGKIQMTHVTKVSDSPIKEKSSKQELLFKQLSVPTIDKPVASPVKGNVSFSSVVKQKRNSDPGSRYSGPQPNVRKSEEFFLDNELRAMAEKKAQAQKASELSTSSSSEEEIEKPEKPSTDAEMHQFREALLKQLGGLGLSQVTLSQIHSELTPDIKVREEPKWPSWLTRQEVPSGKVTILCEKYFSYLFNHKVAAYRDGKLYYVSTTAAWTELPNMVYSVSEYDGDADVKYSAFTFKYPQYEEFKSLSLPEKVATTTKSSGPKPVSIETGKVPVAQPFKGNRELANFQKAGLTQKAYQELRKLKNVPYGKKLTLEEIQDLQSTEPVTSPVPQAAVKKLTATDPIVKTKVSAEKPSESDNKSDAITTASLSAEWGSIKRKFKETPFVENPTTPAERQYLTAYKKLLDKARRSGVEVKIRKPGRLNNVPRSTTRQANKNSPPQQIDALAIISALVSGLSKR